MVLESPCREVGVQGIPSFDPSTCDIGGIRSQGSLGSRVLAEGLVAPAVQGTLRSTQFGSGSMSPCGRVAVGVAPVAASSFRSAVRPVGEREVHSSLKFAKSLNFEASTRPVDQDASADGSNDAAESLVRHSSRNFTNCPIQDPLTRAPAMAMWWSIREPV